MADQTAVYISIVSLVVSIVSACFARSAQMQAKKVAALDTRSEAIKHISDAYFEVTNNGYVGDKALSSIQEAKTSAALVFDPEIRAELDAVYKAAFALNTPDRLKNQHSAENVAIGKRLAALRTRMSDKAALY
jgi:hypothetical protein